MKRLAFGADAGRWRPALSVAVVWVVVLGCSLTGPTISSLSEEWAAKLRAPGSVELVSGGHDAEQTPEGPLAAISWREHGVNLPWAEVLAYVDAELRSNGWLEGGGSSGGRSTQEWDAAAWHKGDRILRLAHRRNTVATNLQGSYLTIYRVTLIGQGVTTD